MSKLLLWGAGGHAKVVLDCALGMGAFEAIALIDDAFVGSGFRGWPVLGDSDRLEAARTLGYSHFLISIGDNAARSKCFEKALRFGLTPATIIHPSAVISPSATIGEGTVVMPRTVVNADARIGVNCIVNTSAVIEHDCTIGDHTHVCPGAMLGGGVRVGAYAHVGIGAVALPGAEISDRATVGAGAVVLKFVPPGVTVVGVPAKVLCYATA